MDTELALKINKYIHEQCIDGVPHDIGWNVVKLFYQPAAKRSFPDNVEIWKWWQAQKFQKEQGEQEYTMIYEIDLPKILKAFTEQFPNCVQRQSI